MLRTNSAKNSSNKIILGEFKSTETTEVKSTLIKGSFKKRDAEVNKEINGDTLKKLQHSKQSFLSTAFSSFKNTESSKLMKSQENSISKINKRTIIFDFDGVIANSKDAVIKAFEEISKRKNVPPISLEEHSNMSTKDLFSRLKIRWYEIPYYVKLARKIVKENSSLIKIDTQIIDFFKKLDLKNINMVIVSSNSKHLITEFLSLNLPDIHFEEIIGDVSMFNKAKKINQVIKSHGKNKDNFVYIGDETRDIIAARRSGIKSIAVLWGKDNEELLLKEKPTFIAKSGLQLNEIIERHINGAS